VSAKPPAPTSLRARVAAMLAEALPAPAWRVIDHDDTVDRIATREAVLIVYRSRTVPANFGDRRNELTVRLLVPNLAPGKSDDALDERLDDLLDAVEANPYLDWSEAERGVFDETWPAYAVTLSILTQKD
jgi:hypothetical protein